MQNDFSEYLVKDYEYWTVYVYQHQNYLGRCVVWCKREDALDLTQATKEEQKELFHILYELKNAAETSFGADWFNYSFFGNETRHLHAHFVPRYSKPKTFFGTNFEDKLYGQNYVTDKEFTTSHELTQEVKSLLKQALN